MKPLLHPIRIRILLLALAVIPSPGCSTAEETHPLSPQDDAFLDDTEHRAVRYFWEQADPETGAVRDWSTPTSPASVAAVGFGLTALCIGAERGWLSRDDVKRRVRTTLLTLRDRWPHHEGILYHFVDARTCHRVWQCEASTIDTAIALAGTLSAGEYFADEARALAQLIYDRADWAHFLDGGSTLRMGWTPERGFTESRWDTYSEHMVLDLLAIGSDTHPVPASSWDAWARPKRQYAGREFIECPTGSLFTHQFSHAWVDFRHVRDKHANYWRNSVQATLAHRQFVIDHASEHGGYGPDCWGLSASDGPDGYRGYGAAEGNHDGTIPPAGAGGAVAMVPELAINALRHMRQQYGDRIWGEYGFRSGFNVDRDWWSQDYLGIDLGITCLMIENLRSEFVWRTFMRDPHVQRAMKLAGFAPDPEASRTDPR